LTPAVGVREWGFQILKQKLHDSKKGCQAKENSR